MMSPHLRCIIRNRLWMPTIERKTLAIQWVNQETQIQGISLIKDIRSCNLFLQYFSITHQQNVQFAAILSKSKSVFVLLPKGTVILAPASLVVCSHSLSCVSCGKCADTAENQHRKDNYFQRQREEWDQLCSHPCEEQCTFGSCMAGSNFSQSWSHKLTVCVRVVTIWTMICPENMDF